jgi:hypothetical protein
MIEYLSEHFRYDTMNSWNCATSYARCIKIQYLDFPDKATEDVAYDVACSDAEWWCESGIWWILRQFAERHSHEWQIHTNGRSSGYMVLLKGFTKSSGYRSYCTECGQRNFTSVMTMPENPTPEDILVKYVIEHNHWRPDVYGSQSEVASLGIPPYRIVEIVAETRRKYQDDKHQMWVTFHNRCGGCGQDSRVNYEKPPMEVGCYPGQGVDMGEQFADWSTYDLKSRINLVWDFDKTVDSCIKAFVGYCKGASVVEETVMVPKTIRVVEHVA